MENGFGGRARVAADSPWGGHCCRPAEMVVAQIREEAAEEGS